MVELKIDINKIPLSQLKKLIQVIGGKSRIEVLRKISDGREWTITKLAKKMDCGVANLSQQVSELEKAGLIVRKTAKTVGANIKIIKPIYDKITIKLR